MINKFKHHKITMIIYKEHTLTGYTKRTINKFNREKRNKL
jgi:hypothetical protein